MTSLPTKIFPWQIRRQRILHGVCTRIAMDRKDGMKAGRACKKGRGRWNRTRLARQRGRHLSESGMRAIYSSWLKDPSLSAFAPRWKSPSRKKITPGQAIQWTRRVISRRITFAELYRRLKRENPRINFAYSTLSNALPGRALKDVRQAHMALLKTERKALAIVAARTAA